MNLFWILLNFSWGRILVAVFNLQIDLFWLTRSVKSLQWFLGVFEELEEEQISLDLDPPLVNFHLHLTGIPGHLYTFTRYTWKPVYILTGTPGYLHVYNNILNRCTWTTVYIWQVYMDTCLHLPGTPGYLYILNRYTWKLAYI